MLIHKLQLLHLVHYQQNINNVLVRIFKLKKNAYLLIAFGMGKYVQTKIQIK